MALISMNSANAIVDINGRHRIRTHYTYLSHWAVTVRANWRVIFKFADGEASEVDYVDYH
jgi:proteic killer suppression protein